jgi:hypothetical protein
MIANVMAGFAQQASAAPMAYAWTYTNSVGAVQAGGFLTTSTADNGGFDVNNFIGDVFGPNGGPITSLEIVPGENNGVGTQVAQPCYATTPNDCLADNIVDNVLYPSMGSLLDQNGIGFVSGGNLWNVFSPSGVPGADELNDAIGNYFPDIYTGGVFAITPITPVPQYLWTYTNSSGTIQADGFLSTSTADNGGFDVNSFIGTVFGPNGGPITGLEIVPAENNGVGTQVAQPCYATTPNDCLADNIVDNVLYPSMDPLLDQNGIGFVSGGNLWNVFSPSGVPGADELNDAIGNYFPDIYTGGVFAITPITPVPEPATWALMLAGLGATARLVRRKSKLTGCHA